MYVSFTVIRKKIAPLPYPKNLGAFLKMNEGYRADILNYNSENHKDQSIGQIYIVPLLHINKGMNFIKLIQ